MPSDVLRDDPFADPPPCGTLIGDLAGARTRSLDIRHRLLYQVLREQRTVEVLRMWSPYE